jgi:hypothetical protein
MFVLILSNTHCYCVLFTFVSGSLFGSLSCIDWDIILWGYWAVRHTTDCLGYWVLSTTVWVSIVWYMGDSH